MPRKIFVENLPFNANDEQVRALFDPFGIVETVTLIIDWNDLRPKGFVEIASGADEAIGALHDKQLNGCRLRVSEARPRTVLASPFRPV